MCVVKLQKVNSVPKINTDKLKKRKCHRALYQCPGLLCKNKLNHKKVKKTRGGEDVGDVSLPLTFLPPPNYVLSFTEHMAVQNF